VALDGFGVTVANCLRKPMLKLKSMWWHTGKQTSESSQMQSMSRYGLCMSLQVLHILGMSKVHLIDLQTCPRTTDSQS
jgi:hypothetical protein